MDKFVYPAVSVKQVFISRNSDSLDKIVNPTSTIWQSRPFSPRFREPGSFLCHFLTWTFVLIERLSFPIPSKVGALRWSPNFNKFFQPLIFSHIKNLSDQISADLKNLWPRVKAFITQENVLWNQAGSTREMHRKGQIRHETTIWTKLDITFNKIIWYKLRALQHVQLFIAHHHICSIPKLHSR
jgi:hypothetical protein